VGRRLAVVVWVINLVSAAPGIPFAPDAALRVAATVTVLASAFIIVLVVLPTSRRVFLRRSRLRETHTPHVVDYDGT
jgi:hypothetical protein